DTKMSANVGANAPDFTVKDGEGRDWRLSDKPGRVVVLLFYPGDETPVCTRQMCSVRDRWEDYAATGAELVHISPVSPAPPRALGRASRGARLRALPERGRAAHRLGNLPAVLEGVARAPEHAHQPLRPRPDERGRASLSLRQHEGLLLRRLRHRTDRHVEGRHRQVVKRSEVGGQRSVKAPVPTTDH